MLVDHAPFENPQIKDILVISQLSQKLALVKNFDPLWIYVEITQTPVVTLAHYRIMETFFSGLNFHLYCLDLDQDGFIDLVLPNQVSNQLQFVRNPGRAYWSKLLTLKDRYSQFSRERL